MEFRTRLLRQMAGWGVGDDSEDLAHDALIVLLQRVRDDALDEPERAYSYLVGIARRLHIAAQRKSYRRQTDADSDLVEQTGTRATAPDQLMAAQELTTLTRKLVEKLGVDRDRLLVQKHYLFDQDSRAVQQDLQLNAEQIHRLLYRCRQRLRVIAAPHATELSGLLA